MTPAIFGIAGPTLSSDERAFFREADPAGYILFARNCLSREQMRALTDSLRALHGRERLLISIDQEGGRVARMQPPEWPAFPAGEAFDARYEIAPATAIEAMFWNARALGAMLAEVGINVDFHAPFDLRRADTVEAIGDRALGGEPKQVAALGRALLDGLAEAGVAGCLKHMPGHGRATVDSHHAMPVVEAQADALEDDLRPFRALASRARIGMTAHLLYPAWDADNPATLSATIIAEVIRGSIGFEGLLLTDDLDMNALGGPVPERARRALEAGCDLALNCWAKMDDMVGIVERCGSASAETRSQLDRALEGLDGSDWSDMEEAIARRDALLAAADAAV